MNTIENTACRLPANHLYYSLFPSPVITLRPNISLKKVDHWNDRLFCCFMV